MPENGGSRFSFWKIVVGVMLALKLKEKYDEYRGVGQEDDEERVRLHRSAPQGDNSLTGEGAIALPDDTSTIAPVQATRRKKKKACCMCCGIDCTLFWKAFVIVLGLSFLWQSFRFVRWMRTPPATGLEGLPAFGDLGCADAPYIYNGSEFTMTRALSNENDHAFVVKGHAFGTIAIFGGDEDLKDVRYDMTVRTNIKKYDDEVGFPKPSFSDGNKIPGRLVMFTTAFTVFMPELCQRFDVKITLPPTTRNFTILSHTTAHIQVDESARLNANDITLIVKDTWRDHDKLALIKVSNKTASKNVHLKIDGKGYIVGDLTVYDTVQISTTGNATANINFTPAPFEAESEGDKPSPAVVRTNTGSGRADFTVWEGSGDKRPFDIAHRSSSTAGEMYLRYEKSGFSGKIYLDARANIVHNTKPIPGIPGESPKKNPDTDTGSPEWNLFVGDVDGDDRLIIHTANWASVYF
ncbi:hypothetical protein BJ165DRAFT_1341602 [Panaeolus papilionaceus]|nr:hypothetical protein BJ165DRAFT_1341602 [Panaeolus papilionaceus]